MSILCCNVFSVFFFKQKTAYEMRISDWISDVCSSDLGRGAGAGLVDGGAAREAVEREWHGERVRLIARDQVREAPARGRRRLEPAIAPAAIEIETVDRDRKSVV